MNTKTYVVQHEWDRAKTNEVVSVVSGIIENSKSGKLPKGFNLAGVMLSKDSPQAYCVWQSESKEALEQLLASVSPPTKHTVSEFDAVYGVGKARVPPTDFFPLGSFSNHTFGEAIVTSSVAAVTSLLSIRRFSKVID